MKIFKPLFSIYLICCCNSCSNEESTIEIKSNQFSADYDISGEWARTSVGDDENSNGLLDNSEIKTGPALSGYDYFRFYANGKCVYDKDMKFDGTYIIKPEKDKDAIFIYPDGLPPGMSEKEKDENAMIFRISAFEKNKLTLKPKHLVTRLVVYKRI